MAVRTFDFTDRPFVGRGRERAVAADLLARRGQVSTLVIGGESGLGKSRLVEQILHDAGSEFVALKVAAVPSTTRAPFELIRSIEGISLTNADQLAAAGAPVRELVRILSEAVRTMFEGRTVFVFEDVHWADPESLEVIDRLLTTGCLDSVVVLTYRTNAVGPNDPLFVLLDRAERRTSTTKVRLEPLGPEEVGEYLHASHRSTDIATTAAVHTRTGGNPLLLSELVAAASLDADLSTDLPWTLAEALRPEIERLPDNQRLLAETVSILGIEVDFSLLEAAVPIGETQLLIELRSLVNAGVLVECCPNLFSFRHDMVREAVAENLFGREHQRVHAAVHDWLVAAGSADDVALVTHAEGAGRHAVAAEAARLGAHRALEAGRSHQALAFVEQALPEFEDDPELFKVAVVASWLNESSQEAMRYLDRWHRCSDGTPDQMAEILHHRVRLMWEMGNSAGADRVAGQLRELVEQMSEGKAAAQAMTDLAQHYMLSGDEAAAIAMAECAMEASSALGNDGVGIHLQARTERASAMLTHRPDRARSIAELMEISRQAERSGDYVIAARALHNIPIQHSFVSAKKHAERVREVSERAGMAWFSTHRYRICLLQVAMIEGDRAAFDNVLEAAFEERYDDPKLDMYASRSAIDRGDWAAARRFAVKASRATGNNRRAAASSPQGLLALIDLERGDPSLLTSWFADLPSVRDDEHFALRLALFSLSSLLERGLASALKDFFARPIVDETYEPAYLAMRSELSGDLQEADKLYEQALGEGMSQTVSEQAEIHIARARIAEALGRDHKRHLVLAAERLSAWPGRKADYVSSLLGERQAIVDSSVLTKREREVVGLVERGLTNGGIADVLYISTKTASVHVSNILSKLQMGSRTEIAVWAATGGLGPTPN